MQVILRSIGGTSAAVAVLTAFVACDGGTQSGAPSGTTKTQAGASTGGVAPDAPTAMGGTSTLAVGGGGAGAMSSVDVGGAPSGAGGTAPDSAGAPSSAGGLAGMAGVGNAGAGGTGFAAHHPQYPGFTLMLAEDFDAPLDLDNDPVWTWSDGGFQTHRFVKEGISFEPGKMVLTLSDTVQPASCSYSGLGDVPERARTSGELRSRHNTFRYGRYEAAIKAPSVQPGDAVIDGNYIASLFVYRTPACQQWREIDIELTGDSPNSYGTNLLFSDGDCNWSADKESHVRFDVAGVNFRTGFVTVGFEWLPGVVTWYYLDAAGQKVDIRTLESERVPDVPGKLMANLWVFDDTFGFGGPEGANNVLPFRSEYDFIRFYKWDQDTQYPCPNFDDSCLLPEDVDLTRNNPCDGIPETGDRFTCMACGATVRSACMPECGL